MNNKKKATKMNRIEFQKIRFRNFLSYGNKWQEIDLQYGINLVVGKDNDTGKSNGSGKSSLLETIPFALFGSIHTEVKQSDIINWKNRKGAEVELYFKKGKDTYSVYRALKPNKFEINKNGKLIDPPSHVKYYQEQLEEILGFNKSTFTKLIHSNINSSKPILSMKKAEKRDFMEKMFCLEIYKKLNELANSKLKGIKDKIRECELEIQASEKYIENMQISIKDMKKNIITVDTDELDKENEKIKQLKKQQVGKIEIERYKEQYEKEKEELIEKEKLLSNINTKIDILTKKYDKIEDILKNKSIKKVPTNEQINEKLKIIEDQVSLLSEEFDKYKSGVISLETQLKILKKQRNDVENNDVCPTCGQDIPHSVCMSFSEEIDKNESKLKYCETNLKQTRHLLEEEKAKLIKLQKLEKTCIIARRDNEDIQKSLEEKDVIERELRQLCELQVKTATRITSLNLAIQTDRIEVKKYEERQELIEKLMNKISQLENDIKSAKQRNSEYRDLIKSNTEKMKEEESKISQWNNNISKSNDLMDYMNYIKDVCSDENAKSLAISKLRPILVKETNSYLSDIGFNFYIDLDNWLNATIKGPGISNGDYKSLSNGEKRTVDLALQNAFLIISRIQAGVLPNILIYDEVLDSSVDGNSLSKIMEIIRNREKEDNLSVFIISHRDDVSEIEPDNTYLVTKNKGYSKVEVK
jgi:DNA repair exonuclease SbcCD ATPase subunit